jgi:hypothetical protein
MVYGCFLFIFWVFYLVIGMLVTSVGMSTEAKLDRLCNYYEAWHLDENTPQPEWDTITDRLSLIDFDVADEISKEMCSFNCPCSQEYAQAWNDLDEDYLNRFGRTKASNPSGQDKDSNGNVYLRFVDPASVP